MKRPSAHFLHLVGVLTRQLSADTLQRLAACNNKERAAWHEAGHYVVATRLGLKAVSKVNRVGSGVTTWKGEPGHIALCAVGWAGAVAEMYFLTGRWRWNWLEADALLSREDRLVIKVTTEMGPMAYSPRVAARMFLRMSCGNEKLERVAVALKEHGVYPLPKRIRWRRIMVAAQNEPPRFL